MACKCNKRSKKSLRKNTNDDRLLVSGLSSFYKNIKKLLHNRKVYVIILHVDKTTYCLRECWNWQTGMTKDHVRVASEGSSPFSRMKKSFKIFILKLFYVIGNSSQGEPSYNIKKHYMLQNLIFLVNCVVLNLVSLL